MDPGIVPSMDLTPEEREQAEQRKAGWQVLCPAHRFIEPETESLLRYLEMRGIDVARGVGGSDIVRVRSRLATATLHARKERVLWVDADQIVAPEDAVRLLLSNEPFVTAAAPSRIPPFRLLIDQGDAPVPFSLGEKGGLLPIRHTGMGMVAHDVGLLELLASSLTMTTEGWYPFFLPFVRPTTTPDGEYRQEYLSEDYAFCERLLEHGIPLVADTRIRCWHLGTKAYRWEDVFFNPPPDQNLDIAIQPAQPTPEPEEAGPEPPEPPPTPPEMPLATAGVLGPSTPADLAALAAFQAEVAADRARIAEAAVQLEAKRQQLAALEAEAAELARKVAAAEPPPAPEAEPPAEEPPRSLADMADLVAQLVRRAPPEFTRRFAQIVSALAPDDEPKQPSVRPPPPDYVPGEAYPRPKA